MSCLSYDFLSLFIWNSYIFLIEFISSSLFCSVAEQTVFIFWFIDSNILCWKSFLRTLQNWLILKKSVCSSILLLVRSIIIFQLRFFICLLIFSVSTFFLFMSSWGFICYNSIDIMILMRVSLFSIRLFFNCSLL